MTLGQIEKKVDTPPPVFLKQSAESLEKEGVEFSTVQKSAQECEKKELESKRGLRVPFECNGNFPHCELLAHTPAVFVRVPNKGVAGYGTWKRIRKMGDKRSKGNKGVGSRGERAGLAGPFAQAALGKVSSINHDPCYH